ncbi:hypothetical protein SORBI_3001G336050 [Sorghum bicolor]|uniref:Uncharacterized protein n=2 Tax=Sorghum bicolor TaxID=4558 RepID=A0A1B6QP01_SORBI|nr:hypothetical protein SORBI_3001G336050 [Sorghum bicolor]
MPMRFFPEKRTKNHYAFPAVAARLGASRSVSLTRAPGAISTVGGKIGRPAGGAGPIQPRGPGPTVPPPPPLFYTKPAAGLHFERRSERGSRSSRSPTDPRRSRRRSPSSPRRCLSFLFSIIKMSRGGSAGGGQSSLGYLFGSGEPPKPAVAPPAACAPPAEKPSAAKPDATKQVAAGVTSQTNNYHRADGQNTGNFLTDRPSTKVHAAPGGGSSLGYLFGGN